MTASCPECGNTTACDRCAVARDSFDTHLADPHRAVGFLDGDLPCRCCYRFVEETALVGGRSVCEREDA